MEPQITATTAEAMAAVGRLDVPELTAAHLIEALTPRPATHHHGPILEAFTKREVCEAVRLSLPTLNRMLSRGEVPYRKFGRSVRIPREVLEELLQVKDRDWARPQCG